MARNNQLHTLQPYVRGMIPDGRCVGKSTAIALSAIADALANPNTKVYIIDHANNPRVNGFTQDIAVRLVQKMGLKFFKFGVDQSGHWVMFELYVS